MNLFTAQKGKLMKTMKKNVQNVFLILILIQVIIACVIVIPLEDIINGGVINVMIKSMVIQDVNPQRDVIIILQMIN